MLLLLLEGVRGRREARLEGGSRLSARRFGVTVSRAEEKRGSSSSAPAAAARRGLRGVVNVGEEDMVRV